MRIVRAIMSLACVALSPGLYAATAPLDYARQTLAIADYRFEVQVPAGYTLEVLTTELNRPRMLTFAANGDLFIGSRSGGIYRLPPPYTKPELLVSLQAYPHSVALRDGEILIATTSGLYRSPYQPGQARIDIADVELLAEIPGGAGHNSRTVGVGPDGRVYLSLGIAGNCSDQYIDDSYPADDRRGGVMVLDESGAPRWRAFATGLRNPVDFAWHPQTGALYAANNGPDHHGYEQPPEYFSRLDPGSFHGMPWFQYNGEHIQRDGCIRRDPPRPMSEVSPPVATFPARNAPMGVAFVPPGTMTSALIGDAVVALHGSWATRPDGGSGGDPASRRQPKLVVVRFADGAAQRVDDLVTGFQLPDGSRWARPTGVAVGPDGALYFASDSGIDALYRLRLDSAQ